MHYIRCECNKLCSEYLHIYNYVITAVSNVISHNKHNEYYNSPAIVCDPNTAPGVKECMFVRCPVAIVRKLSLSSERIWYGVIWRAMTLFTPADVCRLTASACGAIWLVFGPPHTARDCRDTRAMHAYTYATTQRRQQQQQHR